MSDRFPWTEVHSFSPLGIPDAVASSAFGQFSADTAWDVMLQSSCNSTIINIGSFSVSKKMQHSQNSIITKPSSGEPISIPPTWVCLGQTMLMGSE